MAQRSADGPDESPASTIQAGDTSSSIIVVTDSESAQSGSAAEPSKKLPDTVNEEAESEPDSSSGSSSSSASVASTSSISGGSENEASTPLLQGGKGKSTESQSTAGRRGAAAKAKPQPQPKSQLQMKSQASSKKKLKDAEKTVPWPKILAALGVCAAIAAVALWYYEGCTSGPWGEFGDCLPTLRGAPRCGGPGVRKRYRKQVHGKCTPQELVSSETCDMGLCALPDLLLSTPAIPCNEEEAAYIFEKSEIAFGSEAWKAFHQCADAHLCCYACDRIYEGTDQMSCAGQAGGARHLNTSIGCLRCFYSLGLPESHGLEVTCSGNACETHFTTAGQIHEMCCMKLELAKSELELEEEAFEENLQDTTASLRNDHFTRFPDTSAILGKLHNSDEWPITPGEMECQTLCWDDLACHLYTYISMASALEHWRGRCITWSLATAVDYDRSEESTWAPEENTYTGQKASVRYAAMVVTARTADDGASVGPVNVIVCSVHTEDQCQDDEPVVLSDSSCMMKAGCLTPGHIHHFYGVVPVHHSFRLSQVQVSTTSPDDWAFVDMTVDFEGQVLIHHGGEVRVSKGQPWLFEASCVVTSGHGATAQPGMPCVSPCIDDDKTVTQFGWCWVDQSHTYWGLCVAACLPDDDPRVEFAVMGRSDLSCAELNWPTWSKYNSDYSVCGVSDHIPLPHCSPMVSWEGARFFCESVGARLCSRTELENDETAGSGCDLDRHLIWTSTRCETDLYLAVAGATMYKEETGSHCKHPTSVSAYARCCADSRKLVVNFYRSHRDDHTLPPNMFTASTGGLANWQVVQAQGHAGDTTFVLQSGMLEDQAPTNGQYVEATLEKVPIAERGGEIEFWFKISSELGADKLHFYIDDVEQFGSGFPVSGNLDWTQASFTFPAAQLIDMHRFRWRYWKDSSRTEGSDIASIEQIIVYGVLGAS